MRRSMLLLLAVLLPAACAGRQEPVRAVFFEPASAALDAPAQQVVRDAAQAAAARPSAEVGVLAFSAPAGMPAVEERVAADRAAAVRDALVAAGVAPARIRLEARPATPFASVPVESRRVEIRVTPPR